MSIIGSNILAGASGLPTGPAIGDSYEGGYFAGYISHTSNGVATHALIVAPAATGATGAGYTTTTMLQWRTANNTLSGTNDYDGAINTALMVANTISEFPAGNFCNGLTINGYSDWYLPARYELDIAYYNLKPTTSSNHTSWGINNYSVPKRTANYTSGNPTQTSVTAFQSGGAEAFSDSFHWSSTDFAPCCAWIAFFNTGMLNDYNKSQGTARVRAFRKIAV
tara:strand:+ start:361 stop:1029 length:669 start_codon:yes stop_codon:yes gene_type:complete